MQPDPRPSAASAQDALRQTADAVFHTVGEEFFGNLVRHVAQATESDLVLVGELRHDPPRSVDPIAIWMDGQAVSDPSQMAYELSGNPCHEVIRDGVQMYSGDVISSFPDAGFLQASRADSYCGTPLTDSQGRVRGILSMIRRSPYPDPSSTEAVLKIFASRASAELERRRREERSLESRKRESVGQLAAGMAHEFNNALSVVLGSVHRATTDLPHNHPVQADLNRVRSAAERAAKITRDLVAFAGEQSYRPQLSDLNALVQGAVNLIEPSLGPGIVIVTELSPDLGRVYVDPSQFHQVLLNLAMNSRDAMPDGGTITISTEGDPKREANRLTVRDPGVGMDDHILARAFDPFFTTKAVGQGSGLGLASVEGIVRHCGGEIFAESQQGEGAAFTITLPCATEEATKPPAPPTTSPAQTILLVEDEPLVRASVSQALRAEGYHVLEAANGEHALGVSEQHPGDIHVLITDVLMPKIGGFELDSSLRERRQGLKTVFISGYAAQRRLSPGARFLKKPFQPRQLLLEIKHVLDD